VSFLTAGVDVQRDRWVYEVVGWGAGKESWSVDSGVIPGKPENEEDWVKMDELLARVYGSLPVTLLAIDSGDNTQMVYQWARRHVGRVIAVKGVGSARTILGSPTPVDVTIRGQRVTRGCKVWPVGTDIAKTELYGWLRLPDANSPGYCHFPEYGPDFFKQLTAEHLVSVVDRKGFTKREWQQLPRRENHWLDSRVYARAAAACVGLDRMAPKPPPVVAAATAPARVSDTPRVSAPLRPQKQADSRFLARRVTKGWLKKR
jgi:phage terminase large subunit GpA-like protein